MNSNDYIDFERIKIGAEFSELGQFESSMPSALLPRKRSGQQPAADIILMDVCV